jgi:ABC-type anion transport system duplicated permease subunit
VDGTDISVLDRVPEYLQQQVLAMGQAQVGTAIVQMTTVAVILALAVIASILILRYLVKNNDAEGLGILPVMSGSVSLFIFCIMVGCIIARLGNPTYYALYYAVQVARAMGIK